MQDRLADYRVLFYLFELFGCKLSMFIQDVVRHADLPDVVEKRRYLQRITEILLNSYIRNTFELPCDRQAISGDPLGVAVRVRIAGVYRRGHRYRRVDEYAVLADVEPCAGYR